MNSLSLVSIGSEFDVSISFGTSGLRGPATSFDIANINAYIGAFLDHVGAAAGQAVFLGCDLRRSSPQISAHAFSAISAHGQEPIWAGIVPTPALAAASMARNAPAIMITGSHIPEDYNGIKFYRPDGELLKEDEEPIRLQAQKILSKHPEFKSLRIPEQAQPFIEKQYIDRYVSAFGSASLSSLKLGLFKHSAAGRDIMEAIFTALGAEVLAFGQSDQFVAVDTEALDPDSVSKCAQAIADHNLDAVISTDGDGDRPLLIGRDGQQINGDVLCTLAARGLDIEAIITPLTSTTAIEQSGWFSSVVRTRIGSPYVVREMMQSDQQPIAGFEANGGMLLGSNIQIGNSTLSALPTRDAVLPLIAILRETNHNGCSLNVLVDELPPRFMKADRLKQISPEKGRSFLDAVLGSEGVRKNIHPSLAAPYHVDKTDGVRLHLSNDDIVHFRQSGNAPEMRCYVETTQKNDTAKLLNEVMSNLKLAIQ